MSDTLFTVAVVHTWIGKLSIVLKPEPIQTIHYIYQRRDVCLWLPTGFGKSICYVGLPFHFM